MVNTAIVKNNQDNKQTYSIRELVKLSIEERAKILRPIIDKIAEDVNNDPELNLFSHLDGEGIENDD